MHFTITAMAVLAAVTPALAQGAYGLPECISDCISDKLDADDSECDMSDLGDTESMMNCVCGTLDNSEEVRGCMKGCDDDESSAIIAELEGQCDGLEIADDQNEDDDNAAVSRAASSLLAAAGLGAAFLL